MEDLFIENIQRVGYLNGYQIIQTQDYLYTINNENVHITKQTMSKPLNLAYETKEFIANHLYHVNKHEIQQLKKNKYVNQLYKDYQGLVVYFKVLNLYRQAMFYFIKPMGDRVIILKLYKYQTDGYNLYECWKYRQLSMTLRFIYLYTYMNFDITVFDKCNTIQEIRHIIDTDKEMKKNFTKDYYLKKRTPFMYQIHRRYNIDDVMGFTQVNQLLQNRHGYTEQHLRAYNFGEITFMNDELKNLKTNDGRTIAMAFASGQFDIPEIVQHDPKITDNYGYTVAHYIAIYKEVPEQWDIPANMKNRWGNTIAGLYSVLGIPVPEKYRQPSDQIVHQNFGKQYSTIYQLQLSHGIDDPTYSHPDTITDSKGFKQFYYRLIGGLDVSNVEKDKTINIVDETDDDFVCPVCMEDGKQYIPKYHKSCPHKLCFSCYMHIKLYGNKKCPICRKILD